MKKVLYIITIFTALLAVAVSVNYLGNKDSIELETNAPVEEGLNPTESRLTQLTNYNSISPENATREFDMPLWSPRGDQILVTTAGGNGLYLIDPASRIVKTLSDLPGSGYGAAWSVDGEKVYYRKKIGPYNADLVVESIDISSNEVRQYERVNPNGLQSYVLSKQDSDPVVYINTQTLTVEASTVDRNKTWIVASDGQYYHPILSPDQSKVVVHRGNEMLVYAIDGSGLLTTLGTGIATSWSNDSEKVLAFLDESEDGHEVTGSEIYLIHVDGSESRQLTHTPDIFEMWPSWSPDNSMIVFADNKSGRIYTAKILRE